MTERKDNLVTRIKELGLLLGADVSEVSTSDHAGRQSKKIMIEYDITYKKDDGT
tara:strand:- start:467 stop:628 length:162 start_codon:yes stop_codon:yes gene_type:complete